MHWYWFLYHPIFIAIPIYIYILEFHLNLMGTSTSFQSGRVQIRPDHLINCWMRPNGKLWPGNLKLRPPKKTRLIQKCSRDIVSLFFAPSCSHFHCTKPPLLLPTSPTTWCFIMARTKKIAQKSINGKAPRSKPAANKISESATLKSVVKKPHRYRYVSVSLPFQSIPPLV